jgi:hypothetical protein
MGGELLRIVSAIATAFPFGEKERFQRSDDSVFERSSTQIETSRRVNKTKK